MDDTTLIKKALQHYADRLRNLQKDQTIKIGNSTLKNNLESNAVDAEEQIKLVKDDVPTSTDTRKIICIALSCYIIYLKQSTDDIREKLGNLNIEFKEVNYEIEMAEKIRTRLCPSDPNWNYMI